MNGKEMIRRATAAAICVCLAAALSGCGRRGNEEKPPAPTLPPADVSMPAPDGDQAVRRAGDYTVYAYLPEKNTLQLTARNLFLEEGTGLQATAEALVRELLDEMNENRNENERLELYQGDDRDRNVRIPEISGGICTVNLAPSARKLDKKELYWLSLALTATLCGLDEIDGVNVLVADQSVALDTSGNLAMGTLSGRPGENENLPGLWEHMDAKKAPLGNAGGRTPLNAAATVYYPLSDGRGIGCESQMTTFPGQTPDELAETLVTALSETMKRRSGDGTLPVLEDYMLSTPVVTPRENGGRIVSIIFRENIPELLDRWETDLPCLIAAVTCTLTTFVPGVAEVSVRIGDKPVTEMSNSRYTTGTILGGLFHRSEAAVFLTGSVSVFFEKDGKLAACEKPVDREAADSPRTALEALLEGPDRREKENGMNATLPAGVGKEDILGIAAEGDALLVNLSANFRTEIRNAGAEKERLLCYSMVNTLCVNSGLRRVCFFFEAEQAESIAGEIYWSGEFLYNPGL